MGRKYQGQAVLPEEDDTPPDEISIKDIPMTYDRDSVVPEYSLAYKIVKTFGFDPLVLFLLFFIVIPAFFFAAGIAEAGGKRSFFTYTENNGSASTEYIVLKMQDGLIVAAPYEPVSSSYHRSFVARDATDPRVGRLTPVEIKGLSRM